MSTTISDQLKTLGDHRGNLQVRLSNQLIHLLSEQMYSSPIKAMEELVVNAYDADASVCRIGFLPGDADADRAILVFDDGSGMDYLGLEALWHVGESPKVAQDVSPRHGRKLIGKFGIGKLATYAVADKITYLTRHQNGVFYVACDFREFRSAPEGGAADAVPLAVRQFADPTLLLQNDELRTLLQALHVDPGSLATDAVESWTLCVLEELKNKAADIKRGRLKWVIRTAMPLRTDFRIFIDGEQVEKEKEAYQPIVEFSVAELAQGRLASLNDKQEDNVKWEVADGKLVSHLFPSGVSGDVLVTRRSLATGKSTDLGRSHGFFVYVRGRLVNQDDELFGLHALSHATLNFFRADVYADDLHSDVTTPREGIEHGARRTAIAELLLGLFNDARQRQGDYERSLDKKEKEKREHERAFVPPRLVDRPIADALATTNTASTGTDADESWFFLRDVEPASRQAIVEELYQGDPRQYGFTYDRIGKTERLVKLDPSSGEFTLNEDHEVVLAYSDDPRSRQLLEDLATSEVLLEVYLRESGVNPYVIGEVLERRDLLMRSLAQDRVFSLESIAQALLDARDDKHNLEVALVAASRALGFNAKHISRAGQPDGIARFNDYKDGEVKITLEAKSSQNTPTLSHLDFAGLKEHRDSHKASGCLLLAPAYPGQQETTKNSAVEKRAISGEISCWTLDDLVTVVRATETHQITATQILDIVLNQYRPRDVAAAVRELLKTDSMQDYYREILKALRALGAPGKLARSARMVQHISAVLSLEGKLTDVTDDKVRRALIQMGSTSKGMVRISGNHIIFSGDIEEFARRISNLTGDAGNPRKLGRFRTGDPEG